MPTLLKQRTSLRPLTRALIMSCVCLALAALCFFFLSPAAENNDDFAIHTILGGAYKQPSEYALFPNVFFARIIIFLEWVFLNINFFALFEYVALALAFCCVCSIIWNARPDFLGLSLALFVGCYIAPQYYTLMQYTKYSIVIGAAGALCVLFALRGGVKAALLVCGFLLMLFSSLLRFNAFLASLACAVVPCVFALLEDVERKDGVRGFLVKKGRYFAAFGAILVVVFGINLLSDSQYSLNEQTAQQQSRFRAMSAVTDYDLAPYDLYYDEYQSLGISRNDLELIETWSFADPEKFDEQTLLAVAELGKQAQESPIERFSSALSVHTLTKPVFWCCIAAAALALFVCDKRGKISALCSLAAYFAVVFALCCAGRITRWVCLGLLAGTLLSQIYTIAAYSKPELKRAPLTALSASLCALAAVLGVLEYAPLASQPREVNRTALGVYDDLKADAGNLYLADMNSLPSIESCFGTFERCEQRVYGSLYVLGGWTTYSPAKNTTLAEFGVSGSPYSALLEHDNVFLIDTLNYESKINYVHENYDPGAGASLYTTIDGLYVFAFAPSKLDAKVSDDIHINDFSVSLSEVNGSFYQYNLVVSSNLEAQAVYLTLSSNGVEHNYRLNVLDYSNGVYSLSAGIPIIDFSDMSDEISLRLTIKTPEGELFVNRAQD